MKQPSYSVVPCADGRKCVPQEYQAAIQEAQNIVWNDDFFDEEDGIVAVFDYDYDQMISFETPVGAISQTILILSSSLYAVIFLGVYGALGLLALLLVLWCPCMMRQKIRWYAMASHVAITRDGIRLVQDRRKNCWGFSMCDKGKETKTILFDLIADCDVLEPAGNQYFCIPRVLYVVNVVTASSSGSNQGGVRHKLSISGLKEPHKFQALVLAMKRAYCRQYVSSAPALPPLPTATALAFPLEQLEAEIMLVHATEEGTTNATTSGSRSSDAVTALLQSIREELRENNELLRKMYHSDTQVPPTGNLV